MGQGLAFQPTLTSQLPHILPSPTPNPHSTPSLVLSQLGCPVTTVSLDQARGKWPRRVPYGCIKLAASELGEGVGYATSRGGERGRRSCSLSASPWTLSEIFKSEQRWLAGPPDSFPLPAFSDRSHGCSEGHSPGHQVSALGPRASPHPHPNTHNLPRSTPFPPLLTTPSSWDRPFPPTSRAGSFEVEWFVVVVVEVVRVCA